MNTSLKQIQISTFQIKKEFIIKKSSQKTGSAFLYILGSTLLIKFEKVCVFLMAIEKFLHY